MLREQHLYLGTVGAKAWKYHHNFLRQANGWENLLKDGNQYGQPSITELSRPVKAWL